MSDYLKFLGDRGSENMSDYLEFLGDRKSEKHE